MSNNSNDSNGFEHAFVETVIAGGFYFTGAAVDEVIKAQSGGKPSNVGKAGAFALLGALHLNEIQGIVGGWLKGS